jgi:ABC-type multidrug transport system ATPase subunit
MEQKSGTSSSTSINSLSTEEIPQKTSVFWLQIRILMWKQYIVFTRGLKSTFFQIGTPILICIFLVTLQWYATYAFTNNLEKVPSVVNIDKIPKCFGKNCITVGIGFTNPNKTELSQYVINYIAERNSFILGKDVKVIGETYNEMMTFIKNNPNVTQTAILFCTGEFELPTNPLYNGSFNCLRDAPGWDIPMYSIIINSTLTPFLFLGGFNQGEPIDYTSLAVKLAVDAGILSYYKKNSTEQISVEIQSFPRPMDRYLNGFDIVSKVGVFYFYIPPMVTFVVILIELVREKEHKLRNGLAIIGMRSSTYWITWYITGLIFTLIVTNSLILCSYICSFSVFINTPYLIMVVLFTFFSLSMISIAFLLSTIIKTTKSAYTISYAFILIGFVFQNILSDIKLIYLLYSDEIPWWGITARLFMTLYPPFNFSKAFGDINLVAGARYSGALGHWVADNKYTWDDFTRTIYTQIGDYKSVVPSTAYSIVLIIANITSILIITWYLDHVLDSNRGSPDPWHFPFSLNYWKSVVPQLKMLNQLKTKKKEKIPFGEIQQTPEPYVILSEMNNLEKTQGVCIKNLGKVYSETKYFKNVNEIHALKNYSLSMDSKELLTILGHNGAGKSTLISILTGISKPSYGEAFIFGYDISTQMDEIRKILGVCPQHDILWNELTPMEHLILFGRIKELSYKDASDQAEKILAQVNLSHVKNKLAGTFSGGMKRRLSVALACIGNPKIIILDEPTTGMDPINRRNAWKLIRRMKEGKAMILTTHSMEEADVLSDRVCVMVDGELKCIGTSLNLKNSYGDGYRISIITNYPQELTQVLLDELPDLKVIDSSAGSLVIGIPLDKVDQIQHFFSSLEASETGPQSKINQLVSDWGLSNTTLEEVFIKITGKKK